MKNFLILLGISLFTLPALAQKIKFKDDLAYVDDAVYVKWVKRVAGTEVAVSAKNGENEELSIMYFDYVDPNVITKSNPEGKVRWVEFNFLSLNQKCEVESRGHKGLVKMMLENKIYMDGELNAENVARFVQKYGTKFSDNRPGGKVTIIIND